MNLLSGLKKMLIFTSLLPPVLYRIMREANLLQGIGKDRRVGKLSFLEKLRLPQSFAFSAVSGVVPSTPPFLLWHRRLGHVFSPRLRYLISTGMLGSVPNIEISTCMG